MMAPGVQQQRVSPIVHRRVAPQLVCSAAATEGVSVRIYAYSLNLHAHPCVCLCVFARACAWCVCLCVRICV